MEFEILSEDQIKERRIDQLNNSIQIVNTWTEALKKFNKRVKRIKMFIAVFKWTLLFGMILGILSLIKFLGA